MKKLISLFCVLLLPCMAYSSDITFGTVSPNSVLYSGSIRDVKDGTNAATVDAVSANTFTLATTTAAVKAAPGYLEGFIVNQTCASNLVYIHDSTSFPGSVVISSFTATLGSYPVRARFSNGLSVGVSPTCTGGVTFVYR